MFEVIFKNLIHISAPRSAENISALFCLDNMAALGTIYYQASSMQTPEFCQTAEGVRYLLLKSDAEILLPFYSSPVYTTQAILSPPDK